MSSWTPDITEQDQYVKLTRRIQTILASQKAQIDHQAVIVREPSDSRRNWDRLISELQEAEGVLVVAREDQSLLISWFVTVSD
jgi:hypothetical protein